MNKAHRPSRCRSWRSAYRLGIIIAAIQMLCAVMALYSQPPELPDQSVPRLPIYGVGLDEFFIGGASGTQQRNGPVDSLWIFGREMGIKIWELRNWDLKELDTLLAAPHDTTERLILWNDIISEAGYGREVALYPFDSAERSEER